MKILTKITLFLYSLVFLLGTMPSTNIAQGAEVNLIQNASLETVDLANPNKPTGWNADTWGVNTPIFTYDNSGYTGAKSATVTVTARTSGDAKWSHAPVNVVGSTAYNYSDYYKSSTETYVVAQQNDGNGNYTYTNMMAAPASSSWVAYTGSFTTLPATKSVIIFHVIASVGYLTIDDSRLSAAIVSPPPVSAGNLVANESFESATGANMPQDWVQGGWGVNTRTYTYPTLGRTGAKAASVAISAYTSGDVKWYFKPVTVQPHTTYEYSDYYMSNIQSSIVAQLDDGNGNYTYQFIADIPASATWRQYKAAITMNATTRSISIFHIIAGVGSLTLDDVSFKPLIPAVTPVTNKLPNPSLETTSVYAPTTTPEQWFNGSWGNNNASFSYSNIAHTGSKSVRIDTSNFVDGGANWGYDTVPVTGGQQYSFSNYYQASTNSQIIVTVKLANGATQYMWLGNPIVSVGVWTKFAATFTVPATAVSASVVQNIVGNGYVITDDYELSEHAINGFAAPMVSITFDDGISGQYQNALPILNQHGFKGTFYIVSGLLNSCLVNSPCYMTNTQVQNLHASGHEIGSHTIDHSDLTTITPAAITAQLTTSQAVLQQIIGSPVTNFASPYGRVNAAVLNQVQSYYASHRGVELGYNSRDNFNPMRLYVQDINSTTTTAQVQAYVDIAKATNTWLILMYHDVNTDGNVAPGYNTTPSDFAAHMSYIQSSGVAVVTMQQGLGIAANQVQ